MRQISWGNWGITFYEQSEKTQFHAIIYFPVGSQGPQDGHLGSQTRQNYQNMCAAWTERGILPNGAEMYLNPEKPWEGTMKI